MAKEQRQEREREFRVNTILGVANKLFDEKGYSATTLEEIADRAELGRATLYYYFQNSKHLQNLRCHLHEDCKQDYQFQCLNYQLM